MSRFELPWQIFVKMFPAHFHVEKYMTFQENVVFIFFFVVSIFNSSINVKMTSHNDVTSFLIKLHSRPRICNSIYAYYASIT